MSSPATIITARCKIYAKQIKEWKAGKPLSNSSAAARVRFGLAVRLIDGALKPRDAGNLLD